MSTTTPPEGGAGERMAAEQSDSPMLAPRVRPALGYIHHAREAAAGIAAPTIRAKPLEWDHQYLGQWDDKHHGFSIINEPDDEKPYSAAWGEGDAEQFATLAEAKAWCQEQIDAYFARHVMADAATARREAEQPALPSWWSEFITNVCEIPDRNSPEDEPEAMVATADELANCAMRAIESAGTRPCGHPLGTTRWCPDCELAEQPVPAGYWLAPMEIDSDMRSAFHSVTDDDVLQKGNAGSRWAAMRDAHLSTQGQPVQREPLSEGDVLFLIGVAFGPYLDRLTELPIGLLEVAGKISSATGDATMVRRCQELIADIKRSARASGITQEQKP